MMLMVNLRSVYQRLLPTSSVSFIRAAMTVGTTEMVRLALLAEGTTGYYLLHGTHLLLSSWSPMMMRKAMQVPKVYTAMATSHSTPGTFPQTAHTTSW